MNDRSSFELRNAWAKGDYSEIALAINGKNSYGGIVTNYWYFAYSDIFAEYILVDTLATLEKEGIYKWDSGSEQLEKAQKNFNIASVKLIMYSGKELPKDNIKNINQLFKKNLLDNVALIDSIVSSRPAQTKATTKPASIGTTRPAEAN